MTRDFTYVDDIVEGITILLKECINNNVLPQKDVYNIGYGERVQLLDFVDHIEKNLGIEAIRNYTEMHPADAVDTWSDTSKLKSLGYKPTTSVAEGVANFISWYKEYYGVK
jgi:UDP-glucuronate 4-epimerase